MSELQVRGYIVSTTASYLRHRMADQHAKVFANLSPSLRKILDDIKPAQWYPVAAVSELNRVIVAEAGGNVDERARDELRKCGNHMAHEATNTFLKLFMKMLTPGLFAKKLPDLWSRDCSGGRLVVSADDKKLSCQFFDAAGYDHLGAVATGYVGFALEAMGKKIDKVVLRDWSVQQPNFNGVSFDLVWSVS